MEVNIEEYRAMNRLDKIAITKHARIRLEERGISKDEEFIYLITAYFPDSNQWEDDFRTRKER